MAPRFEIIWPEYRFVSEKQIRTWYGDAVANGEADAGLNDPEEMASELSSIGHITLGRGRLSIGSDLRPVPDHVRKYKIGR